MSDRSWYVCEKLRASVLTMMTHRGVPRDRLVMAILTNLSMLKAQDFPAGEIRGAFVRMMDRVNAAAPGEPSIETYEAGFRSLSDDDVRWVTDHLHSLAFAMEAYRAAQAPNRPI